MPPEKKKKVKVPFLKMESDFLQSPIKVLLSGTKLYLYRMSRITLKTQENVTFARKQGHDVSRPKVMSNNILRIPV